MTESGHVQAQLLQRTIDIRMRNLRGLRAVIEALRRKESTPNGIEVYGLDMISMDYFIEIAERVNRTRLEGVYYLADKPFPQTSMCLGMRRA